MTSQLANVAGLAAAVMLLCSCALSISSIVLPWWTGASAGKIVDVSSSLDAEITLWGHKTTVMVEGELQTTEETRSGTWSDFCKNAEASSDTREVPTSCVTIEAMRAFVISGAIFPVFAALVVAASISRQFPLLLLVGVLCATLASVCGVISLIMLVTISTSGAITSSGSRCFVCSVLFNMGGVVTILYAASKAMPRLPPSAEDGAHLPREERVQQERDKAEAQRRALEYNIRRAANSGLNSERSSQKSGDSGSAGKLSAGRGQPVAALRDVLYWNQKDDESIPTEMLEKAFQEIDRDGSGSIELDELIEALQSCGLNASKAATDNIMREIDKNASGDVDIHEFVEFFRYIEELNHFTQKTAQRAQFLSFMCNFCFFIHIVIVFVLMVVFIRMDEAASPDDYNIMKIMLIGFCCFLGLLFACVILKPAVTLTLGPNIETWMAHYNHTRQVGKKSKKPARAAHGGQPGPGGQDLRQAAWANGPPMPAAPVNAAMYGASYRINRTALLNEQAAQQAALMNQQAYGSHPGYESEGSLPVEIPGVILGRNGDIERYNPSAYRTATVKQLEDYHQQSFNPMQMRDMEITNEAPDPHSNAMAFSGGRLQPPAQPWQQQTQQQHMALTAGTFNANMYPR